ncbi:DUF4184 family protein [Brevibacillus sp. NRS-1366]|uniref:DUF4184 family protein n=1 Tax=Brevibacillus sp. NRS-1366 TaxID=3233899 RepID=UPI003D206467
MPFTFAHPAIVLPLRKCKWFSFTALVFGSMAPDFEYFFRMQPLSKFSHTFMGVLWFDLPLVILLSLLYHGVIKKPMIVYLPEWIGRGLSAGDPSTWQLRSWKSMLVFLYSGLLGSLTHIAWDAFTHKGAFFVNRVWLLQQHISLGVMDVPVYKILQHGSTGAGFAAIAFVIWNEGRARVSTVSAPPQVRALEKWLFWSGIAAGGLLVACLYSLHAKGTLSITEPLVHIVPFLSGCMATLIVLGWWLDKARLKK